MCTFFHNIGERRVDTLSFPYKRGDGLMKEFACIVLTPFSRRPSRPSDRTVSLKALCIRVPTDRFRKREKSAVGEVRSLMSSSRRAGGVRGGVEWSSRQLRNATRIIM